MATEDFTTYTETDSGSDLTITAAKVDIDTMATEAVSHVVKDMTAGHFGDFTHLSKHVITAFSGATIRQTHFYWTLCNISNPTWAALNAANVGLSLQCYAWTNPRVRLIDWFDNATDEFNGVAAPPQTYYFTTSRSGTTATCQIYSDAARTNLLDTITIVCQTTTYRYISALGSGGFTASATVTASNEDFDLQEASGWGGERCGVAVAEVDGVTVAEVDGV